MKSFQTRDAIRGAGALVGPDTVVMSLQNGLGHEEILAEAVGRERVLAGKTYVGAVLLGPGHAIAGVRGKLTHIGELDGRITERALRIADTFTRAGLATTVSDNIVGTMWDKLLVNVATGALCAITRLPTGSCTRCPRSKPARLPRSPRRWRWRPRTASGCRPRHRGRVDAGGRRHAARVQDVDASEPGEGAATEIDYVNGSVVRWGERGNVPTPVNRTLVACVKGIELSLQRRAPKA